MISLQRLYRYLLAEPFTWILLVFFQPARFQREFEISGLSFWRRIIPMLRLALPLFLLCYPLGLLGRAMLLPFHLVLHPDIISFLLEPALGIAGGIMGGIVIGIVIGIALGISFGIVGGIVVGIVIGLAGGIVVSIAGGIALGLVVGLAGGIVLGLVVGLAGGIVIGLVVGLAGGIALGLVVGIARGIALGLVVGIAFGIAWSISFLAGYFRLPLYLASGPSTFAAYLRSRQEPPRVFHCLQHSSLHWDERVYLPLPYLKRTLLIACDEDPEKALEEIRFIAAERPQQIRAARAAILELALRDLEARQMFADIAGARQRLDALFPRESRLDKLMDPQWATSLTHLRDASRDAQRYATPIGRRAKYDALTEMVNNLKAIYPNVAFRDQRQNRRLGLVVATWTAAAQGELHELEHLMQKQGKLDNPYIPGIVLQKADDHLFVGRRDIAEQLEIAFRVLSERPTFLLNGERRMGKTSTLVQLPRLLGSRYIPVFYNLQRADIYASTPVFLDWLAEGIQREVRSRGMTIRAVSLSGMRGSQSPLPSPSQSYPSPSKISPSPAPQASQQMSYPPMRDDALAYRELNRWLTEVEAFLEREDKIMLLAFDEFEKLEEKGAQGLLQLPLLLDWFRDIIQFHPRLAVLFSGVGRLEEMGKLTELSWSSAFINVRTLHLGLLHPKDARQLITQPTELFPGDEVYEERVIDAIIEETGCHPFLLQAVCSALIDHLNVEQRERAEPRDVEAALEKVVDAWSGYFYEQWERTDQAQRACLSVLLKGSADIAILIQESQLERDVVRRTLQVLLRRDLVRQNKDETYQLTIPLFGRWVKLNS